MSKKKSASEPGFAKLLDAWNPPTDSGAPVGCLATSFTFSPAFFEEECLARFLQLESDPDEDGPVYVVEREEKMSQLMAAVALIDQHHCRGSRSLRWDLLSARLSPGILHSKVSFLYWTDRIRIIIASANLTEDGYRRNQEVFGTLDFYPGSDSPISCLLDTIAFLRETVLRADSSETPVAAQQRWKQLLDRAAAQAAGWGASDDDLKQAAVRVYPVFTGPGRDTLFDQLGGKWSAASPPVAAHVVSPFFDDSPDCNKPASELWGRVRQRGDAKVHFYVTAEEISGTSSLLLHAPETLRKATPAGRTAAETVFHRLTLPAERPLHAKAIWLEDDRYDAYLVGSSNFTSAGTGLRKGASNIEANLLYVTDSSRDDNVRETLSQSFPASEALQLAPDTQWRAQPDDAETVCEMALLPAGFANALYSAEDPSDPMVLLSFCPPLTGQWAVLFEDKDDVFFDSEMWGSLGFPNPCPALWERERAPSGFRVRMDWTNGTAWWPVNVDSHTDLPPIDELKSLPLEVLLAILSSARPLHRVLASYLQRVAGLGNENANASVVDPHKKVDTARFLLQRTRRISWALNALKERLQSPAATLQALRWRLLGPIGVQAFADALIRESNSEEEKSFVISELALVLSQVVPEEFPGYLSSAEHLQEIQNVIRNLRTMLPGEMIHFPSNLRDYVEAVFAKVLK